MARSRKKNMFTTAESQDVAAQRHTATEQVASAAEFTNGVQSAVPYAQAGIDLAVTSYKRQLGDTTREEFAPIRAAIKAAEAQTDQGGYLEDVSEETLTTSLIAGLGAEDAEDPRILEGRKFFKKLKDAEDRGKSVRAHTETLALKEMKKLANQHPLFEEEVRKAATQELGFDPTGKDVSNLLHTLDIKEKDKGSKTQTAFEKGVEDLVSSGMTEEKAIAQMQIKYRNVNKQEYLLSRSLAGDLSAPEAVDLANVTTANLIDQTISVIQNLQKNPDLVGKSEGQARFDMKATALQQRAAFVRSSGGLPEDVVESGLKRFDETIEQMDKLFESGQIKALVNLDNETRAALAKSEVYGIPGILAFNQAFPGKAFEALSYAQTILSSANYKKGVEHLDPSQAAFNDLNKILIGIEGAYKRSEDGVKAGTQEEVVANIHANNAVTLSPEIDDGEKAVTLKGMAETTPIPALLKQYDSQKHLQQVINNPKLQKMFINIYANERNSASTALANTYADIGKAGILKVNEDGKFVITSEGKDRFADHSQEAVLRKSVERMNNIINLTRRYQGSILVDETGIAEKMLSTFNQDFAPKEDKASYSMSLKDALIPDALQEAGSKVIDSISNVPKKAGLAQKYQQEHGVWPSDEELEALVKSSESGSE